MREANAKGLELTALLKTYKKKAYKQKLKNVGVKNFETIYKSLWRDYDLFGYDEPKYLIS